MSGSDLSPPFSASGFEQGGNGSVWHPVTLLYHHMQALERYMSTGTG